MARATTTLEVNTFVAGLVTDASPLTFPDNASLAEENFVLERDGSRRRRLGMDYEANAVIIDSNELNITGGDIGRSSFKWENAGGDPDKALLAVQFGTRLDLFDLDSTPISDGLITSFNFDSASTQQFSYAEIDGLLVITTGLPEVTVLTYDGTTITESDSRIKVRDLFGVEDSFDGEDLFSGSGVQTRPTSLSNQHNYNLRNQGWTIPRLNANTETINDTISIFVSQPVVNPDGLFPSNSDTVAEGLFSDPNDSDDRIVNRFFAKEVFQNPIGSTKAPQGHYIIDLFDRGTSRLDEWEKSKDRYPKLAFDFNSLPADSTPGGVEVVAEFAGRAWYAGFSGEVEGGDGRSPRLSSYLAFSRLAETASDLTRCFQEADPTSVNQNDLVDTDGGFIRIDGAYGIKGLVNIGQKLVVLAQNGVWLVEGGNNFGFSATAYKVSRISEHGVRGKNSIVVVDNTVMFWGDDGIYHVTTNEFGDSVVTSLTQNRIQRLYDTISIEDKDLSSGYYDTYERKARWVYNTSLNYSGEVLELVLDINLQAFYLNRIKQVGGADNKPVLVVEGNPYVQSLTSQEVIAGEDLVFADTDEVTVDLTVRNTVTRELVYVTVVDTDTDTITYTFSTYNDTSFHDWATTDGTGTDADAFLITGYISGGDFWRDKQLRYLQTYTEQTESLLQGDGDDYSIINPSSCRVQAQWNWCDSRASGRWSNEREMHKLRRHFMVDNVSDTFSTGETVIQGKDKLRGYGKVLSLQFRTKEDHGLHLYGWSMLMSIENAPRK